MSKIRKHALTVIAVAIVVALGLMIWSKKVASVPGGEPPAGTAAQSAGGKPPAQ
jgi:hypothetical protein